MKIARAAVLVVLFGSAMWTSAPEYARLIREGFRERVRGSDELAIQRVVRAVPDGAPVAIVLRKPRDIDRGIFLNAALYPHPTRFYQGATEYFSDLHRPRVIVSVDDGDIRIVDAKDLR